MCLLSNNKKKRKIYLTQIHIYIVRKLCPNCALRKMIGLIGILKNGWNQKFLVNIRILPDTEILIDIIANHHLLVCSFFSLCSIPRIFLNCFPNVKSNSHYGIGSFTIDYPNINTNYQYCYVCVKSQFLTFGHLTDRQYFLNKYSNKYLFEKHL